MAQPKEYLAVAERAAHFVKSKLYNEKTKRLTRSYRNGPSKAPGFLDDYAFLIAGLLDLFECGGDYKWLQWALELQSSQVAHLTRFAASFDVIIVWFDWGKMNRV